MGYPGSVHDARIFNESNISKDPSAFLSSNEWIAGDSAYKLTQPFAHRTEKIHVFDFDETGVDNDDAGEEDDCDETVQLEGEQRRQHIYNECVVNKWMQFTQ